MYYMYQESDDKEFLVVSYKSIAINTYNIFVFSLEDMLIKYWFEGYQLWESSVKGFLLDSNEFLILGKEGMQMIAVGHKPSRVIKDRDGQKRMVHSLGSCDYLKLESSNHILFAM